MNAHAGLVMRRPVTLKGGVRAIMEGLVDWALRSDEGEGITRLKLRVLSDNHRAIGLYESLGFVREGVWRQSVRRGGDGG